MESWIKECERELCDSTGHRGNFDGYLSALAPKDCGGQCTAIWPAGALAYRCRTCQLTTSSAVCVACFKAGGHEDHDWIQYRSPSGGCCDCGDLSAWRLEGCCPAHQPGRRVVPLVHLLPPQPRALLEALLEAAMARLTECLGQCVGGRCTADQRQVALSLCDWLQRFAALSSLRQLLSDALRRPLLPSQRPPSPPPKQQQRVQLGADLDEGAVQGLWSGHEALWYEQQLLRRHLQEMLEVQRQFEAEIQEQPLPPTQEAEMQDVQARIQRHIDGFTRLEHTQEQLMVSERARTANRVDQEPSAGPGGRSTSVTAAAGGGSGAAAGAGLAQGAAGAPPSRMAVVDGQGEAAVKVAVAPTVASRVEGYLEQARTVIARLPPPPSLPSSELSSWQQSAAAPSGLVIQDCLLRRWVLALRLLHPETLHHLTSLLLLLLYDPEFKYDTAVYLMECYAPMLSAIGGLTPARPPRGGGEGGAAGGGLGRHPLCGVLDRLVVQLFNSEEVTVRLLANGCVLETLLSTLSYLTGAFVELIGRNLRAGHLGAPDGRSPGQEDWEVEMKAEQRLSALLDAMRRLASDLCTLVHHVPAARHLLARPELWGEAFLGRCVRPLQAVLPHRRKVSGDVEERAAFRVPLACTAEFVMNACVSELITTMGGMRPAATAARVASSDIGVEASDESCEQRVELLYVAARQALEACEEWCSDRLARSGAVVAAPLSAAQGGGGGIGASGASHTPARRLSSAADLYEGLLAGELEVSPHLPLHRTAAAFLQALLHVERQGGPTGRLARARVQQLLSLRASLDEGSAWRPLSRFLLLGQTFISQIISRRWLRNGEDVTQVELFVLNGRELTDLDMLMIQCWMASEDPDVVLYDTLSAMGGQTFLTAAGVTTPGVVIHGSVGPSAVSPAALSPVVAPAELHDPASASACSEALRWLVSLLRERRSAGLEPRERLRVTVVQWLALRNWTYNQLYDLLPQDLQQQPAGILDEVLEEVATFRAASLAQARQYSLRREAWSLFCPAFLHYTPAMRSRAWEAAMTAARAAGNTSGNGGRGGAVYEAHWQLRRPRHQLPRSLAGMQRVLDSRGMWRLVGWVLRSAVWCEVTSRLSEDMVLGATNLLALQLHRLEDLLEALRSGTPTTSCHATATITTPAAGGAVEVKPGQAMETAVEGAQSVSPGMDQEQCKKGDREDTGIADESDLRAAVVRGVEALTGASLQQQQQQRRQVPDASQLSGAGASSLNPRVSPSSPASPPGILGLIETLLQSHNRLDLVPSSAAGGTAGAAAATAAAAVQLSSEVVDCLQWLRQLARRVVQTAEALGVMGVAGSVSTAVAISPEKEEIASTSDIGGVVGGEAVEAARHRELTRQRQAAMMAKLREQQLAFLRRAASQGGGGGGLDSSGDAEDEDGDEVGEEEESSEEHDDHDDDDEGDRQGQGATAAAAASRQALRSGVDEVEWMEEEESHGGVVLSSEEDIRSGGDGFSRSSSGISEDLDNDRHHNTDRDEESDFTHFTAATTTTTTAAANTAATAATARSGDDTGVACGLPHRRQRRRALLAAAAAAAARQQLPLGRWLPVDIPEPECAVCREGATLGKHGPLAFISHTSVCACIAAPLRRVPAWDAPLTPWHGPTEVVAGGPSAAADPRAEDSSKAAGLTAAAAADPWLRSWRLYGPSVSEVDLAAGLHVHCCGHLIHSRCFERFMSGQLRQYLAGAHFPGSHLVVPTMYEFLCPVCRRLANGIVPAAPFQWRAPALTPPLPPTTCDPAPSASKSLSCAVTGTSEVAELKAGPGPQLQRAGCSRDDSEVELVLGLQCDGSESVGNWSGVRDSDRITRSCDSEGGGRDGSGGGMSYGHDRGEDGVDVSEDVVEGGAEGAANEAVKIALPPLGHADGLGGLQNLLASLKLCEARGKDSAAAAACAAGASVWNGRGCAVERSFGSYGEVVNLVSHQMTREGANHVDHLERALEARARRLQAQKPANPTTTTTVGRQAAQSANNDDGPQQQQQQQPQLDDQTHVQQTAPHSMTDGSEVEDEDRSLAAAPAAALVSITTASTAQAPVAATATATATVSCTDNVSSHHLPGTIVPPLSPLSPATPGSPSTPPLPPFSLMPPLPAPLQPRLVVSSHRAAEVTAAWKSVPGTSRLWAALAHNLAHWEAVRRPQEMTEGVLGRMAVESPPPHAATGAGLAGEGGVAVSGSAVTGLPAVEAAHWRALAALTAMAVCGGAQLAGSSATAGSPPAAALESHLTSAVGAGHAPLPPPGSYHQQSNPQLQPLLAAFHSHLKWLLCELPTCSGYVPSTPEQPPALPLVLTYAVLPPYLPEVVASRLAAALGGGGDVCSDGRGGRVPPVQLHLHSSAYVAALSWRRLGSLDELTADPMLVALELLAVGLSGLAGAALPTPDTNEERLGGPRAATAAAAKAAAAAAVASHWLPQSPHQLLREVLRVVWPIQVLQAALWRVAVTSPRCTTGACATVSLLSAAAADALPLAALLHAVPAPSPRSDQPPPLAASVLSLQGGPGLPTRLVALYRLALQELIGQPQRQFSGNDDHLCVSPGAGSACGCSSAGTLALGGLSACLLPFLVRMYALDCALSRQVPEPGLMLAYSSLSLDSPPPTHRQPHPRHTPRHHHHHRHHQDQHQLHEHHHQQEVGEEAGAHVTTVPLSGGCVGEVPSARSLLSRGSALTVASSSTRAATSMAGVPVPISAVDYVDADGKTATEAVAAALPGAMSATALAGHLVAALGLSDVISALQEPLLLSRRRALEVAAAAGATPIAAAAIAPKAAAVAGSNPHAISTVAASQVPSRDPITEEALLAAVLTRWCGSRALALMSTEVPEQLEEDLQRGDTPTVDVEMAGTAFGPESAKEPPPADPAGGVAAAVAAGMMLSGAVALRPPQQQSHRSELPWYRGLLPPPTLIPLPHLFQSLFLHFVDELCPECGAKPENPALCLLTGRFVCNVWRGCSDVSRAPGLGAGRGGGGVSGGLLHARERCGGSCLLLSLRSTRVVAMRGNRWATCQSPYLDAHGDEDPDLRRGRPLYLDAACYRQLARLWGCAALEFDTQVLHNTRADLVGL